MSLSMQQYTEIMNRYGQLRRDHYMEQQRRRDEVFAAIPDIAHIDETIAHISMEEARKRLFQPDSGENLGDKIAGLSARKIQLLTSHGYPADYLEPIYSCSQCKDTGYIGSQKCSCFTRQILDVLYAQSNLLDITARENFSTFRTDYYSTEVPAGETLSPRDNILDILALSHAFIDQFDCEPGQNLLIYGSAGVGKTFLTHCIADALLKQEKSVVYQTAYQFFDQLANYTFRREEDNKETLSFLLDCDLLIIDDLGTELNNAFINSQLFLCINERMLHKKSTIISTNLSLKQISRTYTERVFSRIIEAYTLFHIYGEDIRIKKAFSPLD